MDFPKKNDVKITSVRCEPAFGPIKSLRIDGTVTTPGIQRRVVCAALRHEEGGIIIGPRHFDAMMHRLISGTGGDWAKAEQGFIDQWGDFMTREEAWKVAEAAKQILRRVGGDEGRLYSENLY